MPRGRKSKGLSKLVKFKIHPDVYEFLEGCASKLNISVSEMIRRIIYREVYEIGFKGKKLE